MVEGILDGGFNDTACFDGRELVFGLTLKFGLANEDRQHGGRRTHHVVGINLRSLLVADTLSEFAKPF